MLTYQMNRIKLAFCCTDAASDTLILIHNGSSAAKAAGSLFLYLLFCERSLWILKRFLRLLY